MFVAEDLDNQGSDKQVCTYYAPNINQLLLSIIYIHTVRTREKRKRQKGVKKTFWGGEGGTSPLASACYSASSRHCGTPPKIWVPD